jgi:hypothetical protein
MSQRRVRVLTWSIVCGALFLFAFFVTQGQDCAPGPACPHFQHVAAKVISIGTLAIWLLGVLFIVRRGTR